MVQIISISVEYSDVKFLKEMHISPTALFRRAVEELRTGKEDINTEVKPEVKAEIYRKKMIKAYDFMQNKGVFDDFLAEKTKSTKE